MTIRVYDISVLILMICAQLWAVTMTFEALSCQKQEEKKIQFYTDDYQTDFY